MTDNKIEITKDKKVEFNEWYQELVFTTGLLDYYQISGCYIILPYAYEIWEHIQQYLDKKIKLMGVKNVYFPLLITESSINKEKDHIAGFQAEVLWVDSECDKSEDRRCVRPTSECGMYPEFSKLIRSNKDLPLMYNQWCNVIRWELNNPTPFIRSKEFLWQEGHCAFSDLNVMKLHMIDVLKMYQDVYENILGVPVIIGKKVKSEKFGGADDTYSVETFISDASRSIQCATVHNLGQNFSKIFDIKYQSENGKNELVYQTSWGFTTRSIGTCIMTHGDNKGLILPPKIAPIEIIIVPIKYSKNQEINDKILNMANAIYDKLKNSFRVKIDNSGKKPGWTYWHWESKGVPFRIEIGPKDVENNKVIIVSRYSGLKNDIKYDDLTIEFMKNNLKDYHEKIFVNAKNNLNKSINVCNTFDEIKMIIAKGNLALTCLCDKDECEKFIKENLHVKPICRPININTLDVIKIYENNKCCMCGNESEQCYLSKTF